VNHTIVTYCDGRECDLSVDLANYLFFERKFPRVLIFHGGWQEWLTKGLPTQ